MGLSVTASKAQLLAACRYPFRADVEVPYEPMSPAAAEGVRKHSVIEAFIRNGTHPEIPTTSGLAAYIASVRPLEPEVGFAIMGDMSAKRTRGRTERGYDRVRGAWAHGTSDAMTTDGAPLVVDWKTGRAPVPPAWQNAQLALAAFALYPHAESVRAAIVTVDERWEVDVDEAELSREALVQLVTALHDAAAETDGAEPRPGPHCASLWCPLRATCPAGIEATNALSTTSASDLVDVASLVRLARALPLVKERIKATETALELYVREHGPLDLGDGYTYREVRRSRSHVEPTDRALAVVRAYGDDEAIGTTIKLGSLSKETRKALDAAGLVSTSETTSCQITRS